MNKLDSAAIALVMLVNAEVTWADDSARCYNILEPDRRNACLAESRKSKNYCYSIKDADRRNICLAGTTGEKSRCYNIRDNDLRASCLAGMGW